MGGRVFKRMDDLDALVGCERDDGSMVRGVLTPTIGVGSSDGDEIEMPGFNSNSLVVKTDVEQSLSRPQRR